MLLRNTFPIMHLIRITRRGHFCHTLHVTMQIGLYLP